MLLLKIFKIIIGPKHLFAKLNEAKIPTDIDVSELRSSLVWCRKSGKIIEIKI